MVGYSFCWVCAFPLRRETRAAADLNRRAGSSRSASGVGEPSRPMKQTVADWEVTIAMFETGSDDSKARRLLRAAMPVTPLTAFTPPPTFSR